MSKGQRTVNIKMTDKDFYTCPNCGSGYITKTFKRCIDCGAAIKWEV